MKRKITSTLSLAVFAALMSPYAMGADRFGYGGDYVRGGYIGANIGMSKADIDEGGIAASLGAGATVSSDDKSVGYKLYGGYRFHRNFAVEGGFFDLGSFEVTAAI